MIDPNEAQLTCVIEALRALDYAPPQHLPTDKSLDDARHELLDVYEQISGHALPKRAPPTAQQRIDWLEFRMLEQQTLGLR